MTDSVGVDEGVASREEGRTADTGGRARYAQGRADGGQPGASRGWRERIAEVVDFASRQLAGSSEVDEFGFDPEFNARVLIPLGRL
ncbi:MAG TPA: hypothetical protein VIV12_15830, partial [Streptosporangiaceae bacterium]